MDVVYKDAFINVNGKDLECRVYQPQDSVNLKGGVVVGIGFSGAIDEDPKARNDVWKNDNTDELARSLAEKGFYALEFSPPGHGRSQGPFSIDDHVAACTFFADKFLRNGEYRFEKVFGLGHCLGAYAIARSAADVNIPYKAVSLLSPFMSVKDIELIDKLKLPLLYNLFKGSGFEKPFCEIALVVVNLLFFPRIEETKSPDFKRKNVWHLKINDVSEFVQHVFDSQSLDNIRIPEDTRVLVAYAERDEVFYKKLTEDRKKSLEERWQKIAKTPIIQTYDADHNFVHKDKPHMVMTADDFKKYIEDTIKLFTNQKI